MPTVLTFNGLRVVIYPNDHTPAHVHVVGPGHEALFSIAADPVELLENYGFRGRELAEIGDELQANRDRLLEEWRRIHG